MTTCVSNTTQARTLLVISVGGAPEPVAASIRHHRPARVCFVVSKETKTKVESDILPILQREGMPDFDFGRYEILEVGDPQDYLQIVDDLRTRLRLQIAGWLGKGEGACVIADITGGTKALSAALAQTATHIWPGCTLSYVGGAERARDGTGIVISGKEQIVHRQNPWEALGFLAVEEARVLFNNGSYPAAIAKLEPFQRNETLPVARKDEFTAFIELCKLFNEWDRFQHKKARAHLNTIVRHGNNMEKILSPESAGRIKKWLEQHTPILDRLASKEDTLEKREALVADLIANARRRISEGCCDDAAARLYRATEGHAQTRLMRFGIDNTGNVPCAEIPEEMARARQHATPEGTCKLGLQEAYRLLAFKGDEAGVRFKELKLDTSESILTTRNNSILAHGYAPITENTAERFLQAVLHLTGIDRKNLIGFPTV